VIEVIIGLVHFWPALLWNSFELESFTEHLQYSRSLWGLSDRWSCVYKWL